MITIDQLLESVDLDFEPRWVTKDENGDIYIWDDRPELDDYIWDAPLEIRSKGLGTIKLAEFENKHCQECIYEVPRKITGKIERLKEARICKDGDVPSITSTVNILNTIINRLNEVIDVVNELKGANNE